MHADTPYSKMAAASDDLGRVARERGIEGHDSMGVFHLQKKIGNFLLGISVEKSAFHLSQVPF